MKSHAQIFMNEVFLEGRVSDEVCFFFRLLPGCNWDPTIPIEVIFAGKGESYGKSAKQCFEDALVLAEFMMRNEVFEGYYAERDGVEINYKYFPDFEKKVREIYTNDPMLFSGESKDTRRRTIDIRLFMIKTDEDAPPVTPEIEKIFEFVKPA